MNTQWLQDAWSRLPPDWDPVPDGTELLRELRRELCIGHALWGVDVRPFARADYSDDIAVLVPGGLIVEVHLTWKRESSAEWPAASKPMSLEEWLASREEDRRWREQD